VTAAIDSGSGPRPAPERENPPLRPAIAVVVARFPRIDETYILREINELERQGQAVVLVALRPDHGKVVHEEAKPWLQRIVYLPLLSLAVLRSNAKRLAREPRRYLGLLLRLLLGTIAHPRTLLRTLALFPRAVHLAGVVGSLGVKHIHAHFATRAATVAYVASALNDGVTFSFTVHGPDVFVHRPFLAEKLAAAKFVRAISLFNKAFVCGLCGANSGDKVAVVHMGLDPDVYARAAAEPREAGSRLHLLSVASLLPNKGFGVLIEACAKLIAEGLDIDCTIVGDGPMREPARRWIADHGMAERIALLGAVPQHEVARLMGACDIFVMPSVVARDGQMDGIPMALIEAMASAKPVVAASLSGIPELVQHDVGGILVDATHTDRIAAAVRRLAEDPALRERLGRAGQAKVRREFDVRDTAAAFIGLLDRHEHVRDENDPAAFIAELDWAGLGMRAIGVRSFDTRKDSAVALVAIADGTSSRDVFVKQHVSSDDRSPGDVARLEHNILETLRTCLPSLPDESGATITYSVPAPLLYDTLHGVIVLDRASGSPLDAIMRDARRRRAARDLVVPFRRAGRWLRLMQDCTRSDEDGRTILTALVVLALRDLELLAVGDRKLRKRRLDIIARVRTLETAVAGQPLAVYGHHGDFWPGNIFMNGERVDVIDFEGFREGLPFEDVTYFLSYIELMPLMRRHVPELRGAFLEGFLEGGELDETTYELFRLLNGLRTLGRNLAAPESLFKKWTHRSVRNEILRSLD